LRHYTNDSIAAGYRDVFEQASARRAGLRQSRSRQLGNVSHSVGGY
jgi:hypothetical protein